MKQSDAKSMLVVRLRECHAPAQQERFGATLLRWIEDPLKPRTENGAVRVNPILRFLAALATLAFMTFLAFSLARL
jgi:hypothetical protein